MLLKIYKSIFALILLLIGVLSLAAEHSPALNKENFIQYFEALESRNFDALRGFYSENIKVRFGENTLDLEGVIEYELAQANFVDISMELIRIVGDESAIAVEAVQTQTMTQSPSDGSLEVGDQFRIHMIIFYTLSNGKITELEVFNLSSEQV